MTPYRVEFASTQAATEFHTLPSEAWDACVQRMVDLAERPWDAAYAWPGDDPAHREVTFGEYGIVAVHVGDDAGLIRIVKIVWGG